MTGCVGAGELLLPWRCWPESGRILCCGIDHAFRQDVLAIGFDLERDERVIPQPNWVRECHQQGKHKALNGLLRFSWISSP